MVGGLGPGPFGPPKSGHVGKRCEIRPQLLSKSNRKPYPGYRMVSLSMTLSDPSFKVTLQLEGEYLAQYVTSRGFLSNS